MFHLDHIAVSPTCYFDSADGLKPFVEIAIQVIETNLDHDEATNEIRLCVDRDDATKIRDAMNTILADKLTEYLAPPEATAPAAAANVRPLGAAHRSVVSGILGQFIQQYGVPALEQLLGDLLAGGLAALQGGAKSTTPVRPPSVAVGA